MKPITPLKSRKDCSFETPCCPRAARRPGSTLLETIIAFFLIAGGITVVSALYLSTFSTQGNDVENATMVMLAESRMAELRAQASGISGFQALSGAVGTVHPADYSGYQVQTLIDSMNVAYPCGGMRTIDYQASYSRVNILVTGPSGKNLSLLSLIGVPVQNVGELLVTRTTGSNPLPADGSADFVARLNAADTTEIPDMQFRFYVAFGSGNGHLEEDLDGRTLHFFNYILNVAGPNLHSGGTMKVIGRTFYAGEEYRGVSDPLSLGI